MGIKVSHHHRRVGAVLSRFEGVTEPGAKRKAIGREFIRSSKRHSASDCRSWRSGQTLFLVQGTLHPDVVESGGGDGTANIKSHHNVGGPPDDLTSNC